MNTKRRWVWSALSLFGLLTASINAGQLVTVTVDRLNVRGQAKLASEVVTQLRKGEQVTVLETITLQNVKPGEPDRWARIRLPANTPVWVYAPYIAQNDFTVNVSRLNLRAGPGENFSVLGRIPRGTPVGQIRVQNNWMEIEAPQEAYAFVALDYLNVPGDLSTPPAGTASDTPGIEEGTTPTTTPPSEPLTPESSVPSDTSSTSTNEPPTETLTLEPEEPLDGGGTNVTDTVSEPVDLGDTGVMAQESEPPKPPKRTVAREGRVVISRSIQAPTEYSLESLESRRVINFLHSEVVRIKLKNFAGRHVILTGEELMDERWSRTPILEVESVLLVQ